MTSGSNSALPRSLSIPPKCGRNDVGLTDRKTACCLGAPSLESPGPGFEASPIGKEQPEGRSNNTPN
eukprot:1495118-Alexandrium_andersonii.AAC.1